MTASVSGAKEAVQQVKLSLPLSPLTTRHVMGRLEALRLELSPRWRRYDNLTPQETPMLPRLFSARFAALSRSLCIPLGPMRFASPHQGGRHD